MRVESALHLIAELAYKPGWKFEAVDYRNRFEDAVMVKVTYPAQRSEREEAAEGYPTEIAPYASFVFVVGDCNEVTLYRRILEVIMKIELHEAREFLRVSGTLWAPFHPHRIDGMKRWGDMENDLLFGVA